MKTRTAPWDYHCRPKPPTPEMLAMEKRALAWWDECHRHYMRGLVTKQEMFRIFEQGPVGIHRTIVP